MFSKECEKRIEYDFQGFASEHPFIQEELQEVTRGCSEEEVLLMKYFYITMPLSDVASYKTEVFLDYAKHGAYLWNNSPYREKIPEDIFLNYVAAYRINEEEISPCRSFFYEQIGGRIVGKTMEEAAIEVNYWCAEEATYRTTDERTVSPMTVYTSAYGRCGEESTFTVSALRSVGVPSRQVYAPRWSHCDDNHAWAEVYCDGVWHFLGACEPEEILDKGWFTNASSRAMMVHSRWFDRIGSGEEEIHNETMVTELNQLSRYGQTVKLKVQVLDQQKQPVKDAKIDFEVVNYSEFYPVSSILSDENGEAELLTGLGSFHIHVSKKGQYQEVFVDTRNVTFQEVIMGQQGEAVMEFEMISPKDTPVNGKQLTQEQKVAGELKFAASAVKRKEKEAAFYKEEEALALVKKYGYSVAILDILKESRGNFPEIIKFLDRDSKSPEREGLLKTLTQKDYRDCKYNVLEEHLQCTLPYETSLPKEIYQQYICAPRVYTEPMTAYRKELLTYFTDGQKESFVENPKLIWDYINSVVEERTAEEYKALVTAPMGCLHIKAGSELSKKILFVAVNRTIGIPARLNPSDLSMEYYKGGHFLPVVSKTGKRGSLKLSSKEATVWVYFQNWSLAILKEGRYESLHLENLIWNNGLEVEVEVEEGQYRLLTSNRLPNGNIFCKSFCFLLEEGDTKALELSLKEAKLSDMLENIGIPEFKLFNDKKEEISALSIAEGKKNLFIWLEESKEPTEHILNELYDRQEEFNKIDGQIIFVMKSHKALQDPTVSRTLNVLPGVKIFYDTFTSNVNTLGRRMYVDPDKLPLIIVTNKGLNGVYAASGYNVGTGDLLLRVLGENLG